MTRDRAVARAFVGPLGVGAVIAVVVAGLHRGWLPVRIGLRHGVPLVLLGTGLLLGAVSVGLRLGLVAGSGERARLATAATCRVHTLGRSLAFLAFGSYLVPPGLVAVASGDVSTGVIVLTLFGLPFFTFGAFEYCRAFVGEPVLATARTRRPDVRVPGLENAVGVVLVATMLLASTAICWAFARTVLPVAVPAGTGTATVLVVLVDAGAVALAAGLLWAVWRRRDAVQRTTAHRRHRWWDS